jgi:cell volume regulation protein A
VRCVVHPQSDIVGVAIRDVPLGEDTWISMIIRDGTVTQPRGSTTLDAGDELLVMTESDPAMLRRLVDATQTGGARPEASDQRPA